MTHASTSIRPEDRETIARLLLEHGELLAKRISNRLRRNAYVDFSADDVLQEVFLDVFRHYRTFRPELGTPIVVWLEKIADNRLATMFRDGGRQKRGKGFRRVDACSDPLFSSAAELVSMLSDRRGSTASQRVARDELVRAVQVGIASLPDDQRKAIQERFIEQRSLESTADAMCRTVSAVRGLLHRGKASLKDVLGSAVSWLDRK